MSSDEIYTINMFCRINTPHIAGRGQSNIINLISFFCGPWQYAHNLTERPEGHETTFAYPVDKGSGSFPNRARECTIIKRRTLLMKEKI